MRTITPNEMLCTMIRMFIESPEIQSLESTLDIASWLDNTEEASNVIEQATKKFAWLETFVLQLEGIMRTMHEKKLTFELRLREGDKEFEYATCKDIENCLLSAYGRKPFVKDIGPAYFAVLIREATSQNAVIATALADFRPFPDIEFATRMEAVSEPWQRQKIATNLFSFIEASVRFLITVDVFVRMNMAGLEPSAMTIKSCVDADAPEWHSEMMGKMGFEDTSCDWNEDEIEFSKVIE